MFCYKKSFLLKIFLVSVKKIKYSNGFCKKKFYNNNVQTVTDLIDSFGKRYKINENDHTFHWLMINEVDPYLVFLSAVNLLINVQ